MKYALKQHNNHLQITLDIPNGANYSAILDAYEDMLMAYDTDVLWSEYELERRLKDNETLGDIVDIDKL